MGSEQSQQVAGGTAADSLMTRANSTHASTSSGSGARLQRGNTIAAPSCSTTGVRGDDESPPFSPSRPISPPISVCSDSDLPYISYTDKPIGDSPKLRNKGQTPTKNVRATPAGAAAKKAIPFKGKPKTSAHNIVVVRAAAKQAGIERDPDIQRIQSIPQFLPVMRGTLSLPANRDPEVLERLQPAHLNNMCHRMQTHFNISANKVAADQNQLTGKIREVDYEISRLLAMMVERQKLYSTYAEQFSKIRGVSQQLSRCNTLLNQNIESMESLNNLLDVEDRLEPFVWTTG